MRPSRPSQPQSRSPESRPPWSIELVCPPEAFWLDEPDDALSDDLLLGEALCDDALPFESPAEVCAATGTAHANPRLTAKAMSFNFTNMLLGLVIKNAACGRSKWRAGPGPLSTANPNTIASWISN